MTTRTILNGLLATVIIIVEVCVAFVSQLYGPLLTWIISYLLVFSTLVVGYLIVSRNARMLLILVYSLMININVILAIPYGNPVGLLILHAVILFFINWMLLFLLSETVSKISRHTGLHRAEIP